MTQAESVHPLTGETVYRWWLDCADGKRRVAWAATKDSAVSRLMARGHEVIDVTPAGPLGEPYEI